MTSTSNTVLAGKDEYPIFIKSLVGQSIVMSVSSEEKVEQLKEKIFLFQGIPQQSQRLVFSGKDLQDRMTLEESGVSKNSDVSLLLHLRGGMQIFVKTMTGRTITLEVEPDSTILSIRKLCAEQKVAPPVDEQPAIRFAGVALKNHLTLKDYKISKESTLSFFLPMCGGSGLNFNQLDDKDMIVRNFVKDAPFWRRVVNGLNYEAICKTPSCDAYQKKVWIQKGYGEFDVLNDIFEGTVCPSCQKYTESPSNIGLVGCTAEINGKMVSPERKAVHKTLEAKRDILTTFKEGAQANWAKLTIKVD